MKPNKIVVIGEYIFDYIILSLLLNTALFLILPFIPIYMGVVAYALDEQKSIRQIFKYIKENSKILLPISIFLLLIFGVFYINVYALQPQDTLLHYFIQVLSYVLLFVGVVVFIYSPYIIYYMKVTTKQAIYNSLLLPLHNPIQALLIIGTVIIYIYLGSHSILLIIFGQYPVIKAISSKIQTNILKLKEKRK